MATLQTEPSAEARSYLRALQARIQRGLPSNYYDLDAPARRRAQGKALGILSPHEQRRLVRLARDYQGPGEKRLRERAAELLVLTNAGFVEDMISRHRARGLEAEVLRQECYESLYDAIGRFDPDLGASFLVFCEWRLRGAISEAIRFDSRLVRLKSRASEIADRAQRALKEFADEGRPSGSVSAAEIAARTGDRPERVDEVLPWVVNALVRLDGPLVDYADGRPDRVLTDAWRTTSRTRLSVGDRSPEDDSFVAAIASNSDVAGEVEAQGEGQALAAALGVLSAYERRVVELYHSLDGGQDIQQTHLFDGVYEDGLGLQYSAEQSVIADRRHHRAIAEQELVEAVKRKKKRPSMPPPIVTATQRELNARYAEGDLIFKPGSPEARELFDLSGVPPTAATIQETLAAAYEKMSTELEPLRIDYIYRGDNALEHSAAAAAAVRGELHKLAQAAGGTLEVNGWGRLTRQEIDRLKPGRTAKEGIGRKGVLRRVAELTGHVDEESGRLTFVSQASPEPAVVVAPPSPAKPLRVKRQVAERVDPRDLIDAGYLRPGERLTLLYKGRQLLADLLHDGRVRLLEDGRVFSTLSTAAEAAKGVRADPGWNSWRVKRGGQQVSLFELREQYRSLGVSASAQTRLDAGVRPHLSSLAETGGEQEASSARPGLDL